MFNRIAIFLLIVLFLSGCATGARKPIRVTSGSGLYEDTENIVMLDGKVRRWLHVVDVSSSKTEDGRLIVKAKFLNKRKIPLQARVQTLFKDKTAHVSDETNWELIMIPPNSYYYYETTSLNDKADKYVIRCKWEKTKKVGGYDD